MENIQKAIALAKSDKAGDKMWFFDPAFDCEYACDNSVLLDPFFWQALGKSLGWGYPNEIDGEPYTPDPSEHYSAIEWEDKWHDFIDHLASGKSPDSFFEELLK